MSTRVVGFDCETDLISTGNKTPTLVCLTLAGGNDTRDIADQLSALPNTKMGEHATGWTALVGQDQALTAWQCALAADKLVAHNMPFDVFVLAHHAHDIRDTSAVNPVLAWAAVAVESGALADTLVVEKLLAIASDRVKFDTRFKPPRRTTFGLATLVEAYHGIDISGNKVKLEKLQKAGTPRGQWPWRYRYIDLVDTEVRYWPLSAADYATEDAVYARSVYLAQHARDISQDGYDVVKDGVVVNELEQTAAWLALHAMAVEGAPVDATTVAQFESDIDVMVEQYEAAARGLGVMRINRCTNCGDNNGGTGYVGAFPNLRVCPICEAQDHETCLRLGVYKRRKALGGIGKLYSKRLTQIVRWGYHNDPPLTERPKNQTPTAHAKWTPSVKTDEETMSVIQHPMVQAYIQGKKATKLRGTYLPPLKAALADGGRLCSNPNILVRSGRTSWTGPNLQNPPRKGRFRESFVAPEGMVMASIDYSTLELAVLAQVCLIMFGKSRMATLINEGTDLHAWFAAQLMGITYEDILSRLGSRDARAKQMRQLAKIPNFGLPGGLGVKGLVRYALNYGVSLEPDTPTMAPSGVQLPSARDLVRAWMSAFPEMRQYFAHLSHESDLSADGRFTVRQFGSNRVRGGSTYTAAANTFFQGLAADGAKAAMWRLFVASYLDRRSSLFGCRAWNFIHDEFLLIGPRDTAHEWAPEASRIMVESMSAYTPDVRQEAPPALMTRWYKDADPVYTPDNTLIPWVPVADLPSEAAEAMPEGFTKTQQVLYASGYADAICAGADHGEAMQEAEWVVDGGSVG